jgi:phenylacetic acid degradation operon negative regulatory protein
MDTVHGASRGRSARLVAFLFGVAGRAELPGPVLLRLLGDLGLSPGAGRALIARLRAGHSLAATRQGRHVTYRLDGTLARGVHRLRTAPTLTPEWSGRFHALLYQVPEDQRAFRDQLRRAAVLNGFGILTPGVLISLYDRFGDLDPVLRTAPASAQVYPARLELDDRAAATAAAQAWNLAALDGTLRGHLHRLSRVETPPAVTGGAALRHLDDLLGPVFIDMLRAPVLPPPLQPADWPMTDLRAAVDRVTELLRPAVDEHLDAVLAATPDRP